MEERKYVWTQVDGQGRVVIPTEVRKAMSLGRGDRVAFVIDGDDIGLITVDQGIRRAQAIARKYVKRTPGRSIVDEFIADRRAEAARE
jgi:AbrB family looped-hinge helix DNA binding protein